MLRLPIYLFVLMEMPNLSIPIPLQVFLVEMLKLNISIWISGDAKLQSLYRPLVDLLVTALVQTILMTGLFFTCCHFCSLLCPDVLMSFMWAPMFSCTFMYILVEPSHNIHITLTITRTLNLSLSYGIMYYRTAYGIIVQNTTDRVVHMSTCARRANWSSFRILKGAHLFYFLIQ